MAAGAAAAAVAVAAAAPRPVYKSAVAMVPPAAMWPALQAFRRLHDRGFVRWPPHVNLLYGFVPDGGFGEAAVRLAAAVEEHRVAPFTCRLSRAGWFVHGAKSATLWLQPECGTPSALIALQAALAGAFPR